MTALTLLISISFFVGVSSTAAECAQNGVSETSARSGTAGKKIVMVGCIYSRDDKYLLISYKQSGGVELRSGKDLKAHVGHKVKIHGTMLNAPSGSGESKLEGNADDQVKQEKHVASHEPENGPLQGFKTNNAFAELRQKVPRKR